MIKYLFPVLVLLITGPVLAEESLTDSLSLRQIKLPKHGTLNLKVPNKWKHKVRRPPRDLPPTIVFTPDSGDAFQVLITTLWDPKGDTGFINTINIKSLIEGDAAKMLSGAVEDSFQIKEFDGKDGKGYYFTATDKAPKPGEYTYATRAGIIIGDMFLSVTVLSRSRTSKAISGTIEMLEKAYNKIE
jgi:hypothetical protein